MNIRPLHDRILVRRIEENAVTNGGIMLASAAIEKPTRGEVVAVGKGKILHNGGIDTPELKVGDKVLFGKLSGTEVKIDEEDLLMMCEEDIVGILN